jgi:hypothetical protein
VNEKRGEEHRKQRLASIGEQRAPARARCKRAPPCAQEILTQISSVEMTRPKLFPSGFLLAVLLVASGLMWAVMFFGPLGHLTDLAGGLRPFDIRPKGYSYDKARAFLEAIGTQGRAYYAIPELVIDTFYPPLYAVSRGLALWWLTMPGRVREAPLPLKIRYTLIAVPILMASLDLLENGCIAVMLRTWPDLSHGLVAVSSFATRVKIMAGVLTEVLMGVLAAIWLARLGINAARDGQV